MLEIHETSLLRPTDDGTSDVIRVPAGPLMRANLRTRIDRSAEFCVHASMAVATERPFGSNVGLLSVSRYGAMASREQYLTDLSAPDADTFSARPKDFVQSISNLPGAQATIATRAVGFFSHLVGGPYATILALWHAEQVLQKDDMDEMVVVAYEALTDELVNLLRRDHPKERFTEGAAAFRLSLPGNSQTSPSGRILGYGFAIGESAVNTALNRALFTAGLRTPLLGQVTVCAEPETFDPEVLIGPDFGVSVCSSMDKPIAFSVTPLWQIIDAFDQSLSSVIVALDGDSAAAVVLDGTPAHNPRR